jgi:dTDP-4-amino-4,6-dideoxygalactose transaminase
MSASALKVPLADPGAEYRAMRGSIELAVKRVLESGRYILAEECSAFEREFAEWLGIAHAVGCGSGTDALTMALRALNVGASSAVVTVSHTAVAVVAAIELAGATPILLDIEPQYYTMDPAELSSVLEHPPAGLPPIRAVIAVHLYGQPVDLDAILEACRQHDVALIEDCSQAHGATWRGQKVGTFGAIAAFSLYPTKNLGAFGDAGVLATPDSILAARLTALRQYGWRDRYHSEEVGMNSRLDELQAAILRAKLPHLDARNRRRQAIASAYDAVLSDETCSAPTRREVAVHAFHRYVVRTLDGPSLQARLHEEGIGAGIHSPVPVHRQRAYAGRVPLGPSGCRATHSVIDQIVEIPIFPELTDAQVDHVCSALRRQRSCPLALSGVARNNLKGDDS